MLTRPLGELTGFMPKRPDPDLRSKGMEADQTEYAVRCKAS